MPSLRNGHGRDRPALLPAGSGQIDTPKLARHFTPDELVEDGIEGLEVYAIRARTLIDTAIALGREGKTMYVWPVHWPWYFSD